MKNLTKIVTGAAATASMLYWLAAPALAAGTSNTGPIDLCNNSGTAGFNIPCNVGISDVVSFAINTLLFVAFVLALVFLVIGGIRWIMSGGDKEATGKAKNTVTSALIGLVVVIAAWVLINIVLQLLTGNGLGSIQLQNLRSGGATGANPTQNCVNGRLVINGSASSVPC